ncbi:NuA4-domain-containing protein [Xylona heveae TC161]|uniref:Chromatin modification-related protein EAF6 n=1 Tax=Xylona heveae (strain CBS 132557 / TC161) TaxID=1328760 RepID=A0A165J976_XYLHT|nr:NuA4-domain-containing protein [Xylona heveae TC161]KZF25921.1 NuA4-domain-containing protein [Xylona heveae TC161]
MAENLVPSTTAAGVDSLPHPAADSTRGLPYYEKLRRDLRETLQKKRLLDKNMSTLEDSIYRFETSYLDDTSGVGNIIRGFDNYIKATSATGPGGAGSAGGAGAGRRRAAGGINDADRVFSRSSVSYTGENTAGGTPTPTPSAGVNAGSGAGAARDSAHGTPASTASGRGGSAAVGGGSTVKKSKKNTGGGGANASSSAAAAAAAAATDDEEGGKATKRMKISYGRD